MKKYIGTKQVSAEPMNLGEFVNSYRNPYGDKITEHEETRRRLSRRIRRWL